MSSSNILSQKQLDMAAQLLLVKKAIKQENEKLKKLREKSKQCEDSLGSALQSLEVEVDNKIPISEDATIQLVNSQQRDRLSINYLETAMYNFFVGEKGMPPETSRALADDLLRYCIDNLQVHHTVKFRMNIATESQQAKKRQKK